VGVAEANRAGAVYRDPLTSWWSSDLDCFEHRNQDRVAQFVELLGQAGNRDQYLVIGGDEQTLALHVGHQRLPDDAVDRDRLGIGQREVFTREVTEGLFEQAAEHAERGAKGALDEHERGIDHGAAPGEDDHLA